MILAATLVGTLAYLEACSVGRAFAAGFALLAAAGTMVIFT